MDKSLLDDALHSKDLYDEIIEVINKRSGLMLFATILGVLKLVESRLIEDTKDCMKEHHE